MHGYVLGISTLQVRDVRPETAEILRRRAEADGVSLSAYLRGQLDRIASVPSRAEVLERIAAPELLGAELLSVLRGGVRGRGLDPGRAQDALVDLEDLGIAWYTERPLLRVAWGLGDRASAYDAMYLALARALSVPGRDVKVLTLDQRLARAFPDLTLVPEATES